MPSKPRTGRGDKFAHGGSPDQRHLPPRGREAWDINIPELDIKSVKPKARDSS